LTYCGQVGFIGKFYSIFRVSWAKIYWWAWVQTNWRMSRQTTVRVSVFLPEILTGHLSNVRLEC